MLVTEAVYIPVLIITASGIKACHGRDASGHTGSKTETKDYEIRTAIKNKSKVFAACRINGPE